MKLWLNIFDGGCSSQKLAVNNRRLHGGFHYRWPPTNFLYQIMISTSERNFECLFRSYAEYA